MDLLEYQGKQLFAKHGIAVPSGEVAETVDEAVAAAEQIGYPCAIKAQVLIGGRGKAGGIKIAKDADEAREYADAIIGMDIVGPHGEGPFRVDQVWIEGGSDIAAEYYASVILDRGEKKLLAMVSAKGGMDIEAVAAEDPDALVKRHIDPTREFDAAAARAIVADAGLAEDALDQAAEVLVKLAEVASEEDANLIEVNPLIVTADREVVALDAKVTIDGNALFRHQDLAEIADTVEDPQEAMAKEKGLTYVKLDGNVGILANGAGLCMSTLDVVAQAGGAPANFLDAGGGSKAEAIVNALEVIVSDAKVTAILFNIFGGITRCDEIAKGIVTASQPARPRLPLVVRLDGTNSEEGLAILAEADLPNLHQEKTMLDAARRVVELAGGASMSIIVGDEHEARRLRPDRPRGLLPRAAQPRLRDRPGRRRHARQGRPGRRGRAGLRHDQGVGRGGRRQHLDDLRAGALRGAGDRRGDRVRGRDGDRDHRGDPGARHAEDLLEGEGGGGAADRARTAPASSRPARPTSASSPPSSSTRARSASSPSRGR